NTITLTDNGESQFPQDVQDLFIIPDLSVALSEIEGDDSLTPEEKKEKAEKMYSMHSERSEKVHSIQQLLKGYMLFEKDVEYVIQDGKVVIVDEFTGRLMAGRRYSDGLHQAIEAKENVRIEGESQTLATITMQNAFRMYSKLAGMTGTAETEAEEFANIYGLDVVCIPPNVTIIRDDTEDEIYRTRREKYNGIIEEIQAVHEEGRPILVGTISVEVSETLSRMLKRTGVKHNVLNAKFHQSEAEIVINAGQPGQVTIATNMAGRGTDIKLGEGVVAVGGLHIIGTERHESRRIDRQLRGRAGRQGDPGSSKFFLSLEDDLMRLFGGDRLGSIMDKLGLEDGEVIRAKMVTSAIERAQKKVEAQNFSIRKHTLEYDDVMNVQRNWIYQRRTAALTRASIKDEALELIEATLINMLEIYCPPKLEPYQWDMEGFKADLRNTYLINFEVSDDEIATLGRHDTFEKLLEAVMHIYTQKEEAYGKNFTIRIDGTDIDCGVRLNVKRAAGQVTPVTVGDDVEITLLGDNRGIIEKVFKRRTSFFRPSKGRTSHKQAIAANIDQLAIVVSVAEPPLKPRLIDRFTVVAELGGLTPLVVINKTDLGRPPLVDALLAGYRKIGIPALAVSASIEEGLEEIRELLDNKRTLFVGHSGVGKSTLLNALLPGTNIKTAEISERNQKGRHTTTRVELHEMPTGGFLVDSPGLKILSLWEVTERNLAGHFREFAEFTPDCKFNDCRHLHEPNCAVKAAFAEG
ncbi:ribosome small subunit-dependent GTPase A, partial [bacterium AH-315-F03]|nr:ribosome small subunit-dependent GTPase A [bacterium AH-315-F03]